MRLPLEKRPQCTVIWRGWSMIQTVLEALQFHVTKSLDLSLESVDYAEIITPLVFLAGDWTEVGPLWTTLREKHQLVAFLNLGSKPDLDTGQWSLVSHVEHDGVTDGRWWCGTSFLVEQWNKVGVSSVFKVTEGSTQGELGTEARFYSTTKKKEQIKREF